MTDKMHLLACITSDVFAIGRLDEAVTVGRPLTLTAGIKTTMTSPVAAMTARGDCTRLVTTAGAVYWLIPAPTIAAALSMAAAFEHEIEVQNESYK